ncbi:MAG TPA: DUF934 domain-containing protein [Caulobacteraceae bacterium]
MPKLIRLRDGVFGWEDDGFTLVGDEDELPAGDAIVSLKRFMAEGEALLAERKVGVKLSPSEAVEDLVYDLPRLALVALEFPSHRDGRNLSAARLLRQRYGYQGELRAVGEVLREQAQHMVRCGIDAFAAADGSTPEVWAEAAHRYRHVYQRAADERTPAFVERGTGG